MQTEIQAKFATYPAKAQRNLETVRRLIFSVAKEYDLGEVEETLKWGEASYSVKSGSPVRLDWKSKEPNVIKMYFHCQTKLIDTFREIYPDEFEYEGRRAIVIPLNANIDKSPLKHCLELALRYHRLKHLPMLGVKIELP